MRFQKKLRTSQKGVDGGHPFERQVAGIAEAMVSCSGKCSGIKPVDGCKGLFIGNGRDKIDQLQRMVAELLDENQPQQESGDRERDGKAASIVQPATCCCKMSRIKWKADRQYLQSNESYNARAVVNTVKRKLDEAL